MIDPSTVQIVVMAYREEPNRHLQAWLNALASRGYEWRYGPETHPVYVARNQVVHRFLAEDTDKEHLVMIDAPLVPIAGQTSRVLTEPGEVVYCGYFGRYGTAGHYASFGCGCFRASRRVYEALPPPWFDFGYDETLTRKTQCECRRFEKRVVEITLDGLSVVPIRVGIIGRLTPMLLVPDSDGRPRVLSPHVSAERPPAVLADAESLARRVLNAAGAPPPRGDA